VYDWNVTESVGPGWPLGLFLRANRSIRPMRLRSTWLQLTRLPPTRLPPKRLPLTHLELTRLRPTQLRLADSLHADLADRRGWHWPDDRIL